MIDVVCHHEPAQLPPRSASCVPVLLYGNQPSGGDGTSIGAPVYAAVRRLGIPVRQAAFDFLTVALAVTAADTFVLRSDSPDGWTRHIRLRVSLLDPDRWLAVAPRFEAALRFLSGDVWTLDFRADGPARPDPQTRGSILPLSGHDSVCLFSGGLDSTIGALDLLASGAHPILVSHGYRGDQSRQREIHRRIAGTLSWFTANANPLSRMPNDTTMRTRSLNFVAYAALVASALADLASAPMRLVIPENGFIALNAPLTRRRLGSLSTRTTHPHFLRLVQDVLAQAGIPVTLENPYRLRTKGEIMTECANQAALSAVASRTVSCGKWKRRGVQCGRCFPCIIRRSSFHSLGLTDTTEYRCQDLRSALDSVGERDDVLAMLLAVRRADSRYMASWVAQSGPLSADPAERAQQVDVFRRGLKEAGAYLSGIGLL